MKSGKSICDFKNRKGLTLIEVILGMAIIGIISISFLNMFTTSYSAIFSAGHKTRAVADAQAFMESVYDDGNLNIDDSNSNIYKFDDSRADLIINKKINLSDMVYDESKPLERVFYHVNPITIDTLPYRKVTVMVTYQNGKNQVSLTTIVP